MHLVLLSVRSGSSSAWLSHMSVSLDTRTEGDTDVANTQDALRDMLVGKEELLLDWEGGDGCMSVRDERSPKAGTRTSLEFQQCVVLPGVDRYTRLSSAHRFRR